MFQWQFKTVARHNYWMPHKRATYPINALDELLAHILHGIPIGAMYKEVTQRRENNYNDDHLEAAFHS
jgi:hypothetical protein